MTEKSRTRIKKEMTALQGLGEKLSRLSDAQLVHPAIPEALRRAVLDFKSMHGRETRRRQFQFIGRLMRDLDPGPLQALIRDIEGGRRDGVVRFQEAESWRDRLIGGDDVLLDRLLGRFPDLETVSLDHLIRIARKNPLSDTGKRASRELFRVLHDLLVREGRAEPEERNEA
ncbi:MAG TPA: DUF615 domain-containing protein [bacterium]|nr:DUF615 domain-containing protein [bacterium]